MTAKNTIMQLIYMFAPFIIFKTLYGHFGLVPAIISSLTFIISMMIYNYKKKGRVGNILIISLFFNILSFISYLLSSNERFYFIPGILQVAIFIIWILIFIVRKKCFILFFMEDFNVPCVDEMDEKEFLSLNYVWLFTHVLRLAIKVISLVFMDLNFETLYWISFLSGDPITVPVIYYTFRYFDKKIKAYYNETYKTESEEALQ